MLSQVWWDVALLASSFSPLATCALRVEWSEQEASDLLVVGRPGGSDVFHQELGVGFLRVKLTQQF